MGKITAEYRKKHGIKSGPNKGKYPIGSVQDALDAIKLRNSGKGITAGQVLGRVARSKHGKNARVQAALKAAREKDRKK